MIETQEPAGTPTAKTAPKLFGSDTFPDNMWYLWDQDKNKFGAFHVDDAKIYDEPIDCMTVFRTPEEADQWGALLDTCFVIPYPVSFDEAREIALGAGKGFRALALMDDWDKPLLHFLN